MYFAVYSCTRPQSNFSYLTGSMLKVRYPIRYQIKASVYNDNLPNSLLFVYLSHHVHCIIYDNTQLNQHKMNWAFGRLQSGFAVFEASF